MVLEFHTPIDQPFSIRPYWEVILENDLSDTVEVTSSGVLKVSVLAQIYINDIPNYLLSKVWILADGAIV